MAARRRRVGSRCLIASSSPCVSSSAADSMSSSSASAAANPDSRSTLLCSHVADAGPRRCQRRVRALHVAVGVESALERRVLLAPTALGHDSVSLSSPLANALMGRHVGDSDVVSVMPAVPVRHLTIVAID